MDELLPELLVYISKDSYEVWIKLENSIAWFARYCRKNKLSYYNQFTRRFDYPKCIGMDSDKCGCYYCTESVNDKSYDYKITPEIYRNSLYVFKLIEDVIYPDIKVTITFPKEDEIDSDTFTMKLDINTYKFERDNKLINSGLLHRDHEPALVVHDRDEDGVFNDK